MNRSFFLKGALLAGASMLAMVVASGARAETFDMSGTFTVPT
jgi:hypothetical protein